MRRRRSYYTPTPQREIKWLHYTVPELVEAARAIGSCHGKEYTEKDFCPYTWSDTLTALERGWEGGVSEIDARINGITASGEAEEITIRRDVFGDYFDVGAVLAGEPEHWFQLDSEPTPQKELTIYINQSASVGVRQGDIYNRGAVICNMIDRLQKEYFIRLVFQFGGVNCDTAEKVQSLVIQVEMDTRNGYSRSLLAFLTAHPGLLRRIFLSFLERENGQYNCPGHGRPYREAYTPKAGEAFIPAIESCGDCSTIASAMKSLNKSIVIGGAE